MSEMKLASDFNGKFNIESNPYITIDKNNSAKIFDNLNFEKFNLKLDANSTIISDNNVSITSQDFRYTIQNNTSLGAYTIVFNKCNFDTLDIHVLTCNVIFKNCTIGILNICNRNYSKKSRDIQINGGSITKLNIEKSVITNKFYINKQSEINNQEITIDKLIINDTCFKENFK